MHHLMLTLALALLSATTGAGAPVDPTFAKTILPFLQAHCVDCHGPKA